MKAKITSRVVKSLKPAEKPFEVNDTQLKGFLLRMEPSGKFNYYAAYRLPDGRRSRRKLNKDVPLTPTQARDAAIAVFNEVRKGIDPNESVKEKVHTLKSFLDSVYEEWMLREYPSGGKAQISRIKSSCKPLMAMRLSSLTAGKVEKWRTERLGGKRKRATVNRDLSALKGLLARAMEWGHLDSHPFGEVKVRRKAEDDSAEVRCIEADEEARLFAALDARAERKRAGRDSANQWRGERGYAKLTSLRDRRFVDYLRPMIAVALHTGLRRGELFNLQWTDLSLTRGKGKTPMLTVQGRTAKSGKTRHIPLNEVAFDTLRDWKTQSSGSELVFPNNSGERFDNISGTWARLLKEASISGLRFHDLRHSFASRLVQNGVKLPIVKDLLGHSSYKLTLRYAHIDAKDFSEAVARLVPAPSDTVLEFPANARK